MAVTVRDASLTSVAADEDGCLLVAFYDSDDREIAAFRLHLEAAGDLVEQLEAGWPAAAAAVAAALGEGGDD